MENRDEILNAAEDWRYLIVQAGGMARKSDLDEWLMHRFNLTAYEARQCSNDCEYRHLQYFSILNDGVLWNERKAGRPAPTLEQYGGLKGITLDYRIGAIRTWKESGGV